MTLELDYEEAKAVLQLLNSRQQVSGIERYTQKVLDDVHDRVADAVRNWSEPAVETVPPAPIGSDTVEE